MSCGVGPRHGLDPALLWLCYRLAAVAAIGPLAWEPPYATRVALKSKISEIFNFFNFLKIMYIHIRKFKKIKIVAILTSKKKKERK